MNRECLSIQRAIGEKFGQIVFSFSMCLSGLSLGFVKGWSLALVICAIGPMFMCGMIVFGKAMKSQAIATMRAYG